jgi:hypothetical protein
MRTISIFVILLLMIGIVSAVPVTQPATAVGNNNFTLNGAGAAAGVYYFKWGDAPTFMYMKTVNQTGAGGAISYREWGAPIIPSTAYYYVACDSSGCDVTSETFTTAAVTPLTQTTLGYALDNLTGSKFNVLTLPQNIMWPFGARLPENRQTMYSITFAILMLGFFGGWWLRSKDVKSGVVATLLIGGFLFSSTATLGITLPAEASGIAQGMFIMAIAGVGLSLLKR